MYQLGEGTLLYTSTQKGVGLQMVWRHLHGFLTFALGGCVWLGSCSVHFYPRGGGGESVPGTHWIGDWVSYRGGRDVIMKRKILSLASYNLPGPMKSHHDNAKAFNIC